MKLAKYLFGLVAAFALALPAQAITRVGTSTSSATTITCPTHAIGDMLLISAVRASATPSTVPVTWIAIRSGNVATATAASLITGYRIATSTTDASGTWTNASNMVCQAYHPTAGATILIGQNAGSTSTTATVTYPALTLAQTSGSSWIVGFVGASNITQTLTAAPTGMTNESTLVGAANSIAGFDTTAGVSSWTSQTANVVGTGHAVSMTIELVESAFGTGPTNVYQYVAGAANVSSRFLTGNAFTLPLPNISGAGNTIVIDFSFDSALTVSSVTGSVNGTYTVAKTAFPATGNISSATYYHANVSAGSANEIITVTLSANTQAFQFEEIEYYGVSTSSPLNGSASTALTTTTAAGSFTPGNNNANGGNIIHSYFIKSAQFPSNLTTGIFPGPGFQLVSGNIAWVNAADGMPAAVETGIQATSAAINPSITSIAESGDNWNGISTAWALSPGAGTPPSTAVTISGIQHFSTTHFPATGMYAIGVAATGNLRVVSSTDPNLNTLTLSDSEGGSWTAAAAGSGFWYRANTTPNPNLIIYVNGGGADASLSFAFSDVANAATTSVLNSSNVSNQITSGLSSFTASPSPSPTSTNGITIANIGLGQGPGLGVTSPTGAVFDFAGYSGETDSDGLNNADLMAHYVNTVSGAQTWTFSITNVVSNSTSGGWATFVGQAGTSLATMAVTNGADVMNATLTATGGGGGGGNTGFFFSAKNLPAAANDDSYLCERMVIGFR